MDLNDLWISEEPIDRLTVSGSALQLRLGGRWDELPLLFDLPSQLALQRDHVVIRTNGDSIKATQISNGKPVSDPTCPAP